MLFVASQPGRIKFSNDADVLPPDANWFEAVPLGDNANRELDVAKRMITPLEKAGLNVCVDFGNFFYETAE